MCNALTRDSGATHYTKCYCNEDQGCGYTFSDEYGSCAFCNGEHDFDYGAVICAGPDNVMRRCPDENS